MISQTFVITNGIGLHLKPATMLCTEAIKYESSIMLSTERARINAKSVLNVLGACVRQDDRFEVICDGEDEGEALKNITRLITENFGATVSS